MQQKKSQLKKIYIVAGEASGDLLGGKLISALKKQNKNLQFRGVGGEKMISEGFSSIFKMSDLSVMGFIEVLPSIPRIYDRLISTVKDIEQYKPDVIITIDSPGFNFRLAAKIRQKMGDSIKLIHYVAPSVWAYRPERVQIVKALYNHLLLILPFEKKYFDKVEMPSTFVGHPILEDEPESRKIDEKLLIMMPGSRMSEVRRHLPIFLKSLDIVKREVSDLRVFIPTIPKVRKYIQKKIAKYPYISFSDDALVKKQQLGKTCAAVVKSGTSAMEMVANNIPAVVAYKINFLSAMYLKSQLQIKYASIINILQDKEIIKEFLQEKLNPVDLSQEILHLLQDKKYRANLLNEYEEAKKLLIDKSKPAPSEQAALVVLKEIA